MSAEQDPARLFPEGFYDRLERLSIQNHSPETRDGAQAELKRHYESYEKKAAEVCSQRTAVLPIFKFGMSMGMVATVFGFVEKQPDAFMFGTGLLAGSIGGALLQKQVEVTRVQLSQERVSAIDALIGSPNKGEQL